MSAESSLDAAAQQLTALLAALDLSNVQVLQAQDQGSADNILINPQPALQAFGPGVMLLVDVAQPNVTQTPYITIGSLGRIPITTQQAGPVPIGAVAGKATFALSSVPGSGYAARLLGTASPFNIANLTAIGTLTLADQVAILLGESEGGLGQGSMARVPLNSILSLFQSALNVGSGGSSAPTATVTPGVVNVLVAAGSSMVLPQGGIYTISSWGGISSTFTNSSFDGTTFTVGTGEAGYYDLEMCFSLSAGVYGCFGFVYVNGTQVADATDAGDFSAQYTYGTMVGTKRRLGVGDKVTFAGKASTNGGSRTLGSSSCSITQIR